MPFSNRGVIRKSNHIRVRAVAALIIAVMAFPLSPAQAEVAGEHARSRLSSVINLFKPSGRSLPQIEEAPQREARVTRVRLCPRRLLMYVGEEKVLSPLPLDNKGEPVHGISFSWESSDVSVAEVASGGSVIAKAAGRCIITATLGNRRDKVAVEVREGRRPFLTGAQWDAEHANDCNDPERDPSTNDAEPGASSAGAFAPTLLPPREEEDPPNITQGGSPANATGHPRFLPNLERVA